MICISGPWIFNLILFLVKIRLLEARSAAINHYSNIAE